MSQLSRRAVLRLLGVSGAGVAAGCTSAALPGGNQNSNREPGTLVVKNQHSLGHVVHVSVTGPDSAENGNVSGEASYVLANGLDGQISVDAGETKAYSDFLSGSVQYTVAAWLGSATKSDATTDGNDSDKAIELQFSPAAATASDARGSFLTIEVEQTGDLSWHVSYLQ